MRTLVFDIETVGGDFSALDEESQAYFLKYADSPQKAAAAQDSLSFYPLTAQVVTIAMLDARTRQGAVFYQAPGQPVGKQRQDGVVFSTGTEQQILASFWKHVQRYDRFVTFNGRCFDGPFLMIRSAVHRLKAARNLLPYRYSHGSHVDLADQLSFYDAMRRKFPLRMWCQALGVPSPKEEGITGLMVKDLFHQGKFMDIARYCLKDVQATLELYQVWEQFLRID